MEDTLIELLSTYGFPVYRQGSLQEGTKYPDDMFTFWNVESPDHAHYDNKRYGTVWEYDVNFYSVNPTNPYTYTESAINLLKLNGWTVGSRARDIASDEPTQTGRGFTAYYLDTDKEG